VNAKTDTEAFRFSVEQTLSGNILWVRNLPHKPIKLRESDVGAIIYCKLIDGRSIRLIVLTRELYDEFAEGEFSLYCDDDGLRANNR
jgi:hypothetical protein